MIEARFKPITQWPKKPTPSHARKHRFRAKWQQTLDLLEFELSKLHARDITIEAFFRPNDIRNDGWPYANAKASQPGVVLRFTTKGKEAEFACDKFSDWQQNLRAIALGLEKLRTIEEYGIVVEEEQQYRGWFRELPASSNESQAAEYAKMLVKHCSAPTTVEQVLSSRDVFESAWKAAFHQTHPDKNSHKPNYDVDSFRQVMAARDNIRNLKGWS